VAWYPRKPVTDIHFLAGPRCYFDASLRLLGWSLAELRCGREDEAAFKKTLEREVESAMGLRQDKVKVYHLGEGSILAQIRVEATKSGHDGASDDDEVKALSCKLEHLITDRGSSLHAGSLLRGHLDPDYDPKIRMVDQSARTKAKLLLPSNGGFGGRRGSKPLIEAWLNGAVMAEVDEEMRLEELRGEEMNDVGYIDTVSTAATSSKQNIDVPLGKHNAPTPTHVPVHLPFKPVVGALLCLYVSYRAHVFITSMMQAMAPPPPPPPPPPSTVWLLVLFALGSASSKILYVAVISCLDRLPSPYYMQKSQRMILAWACLLFSLGISCAYVGLSLVREDPLRFHPPSRHAQGLMEILVCLLGASIVTGIIIIRARFASIYSHFKAQNVMRGLRSLPSEDVASICLGSKTLSIGMLALTVLRSSSYQARASLANLFVFEFLLMGFFFVMQASSIDILHSTLLPAKVSHMAMEVQHLSHISQFLNRDMNLP